MADNRFIEIEQRLSEDINRLDTKIHNLEMALHRIEQNMRSDQRPDSNIDKRISDIEHLLSSIEMRLFDKGGHPHFEDSMADKKIISIETNMQNMLGRINSLETQEVGSGHNDQNVQKITALRNELDNIRVRNRSGDIVRIEENVNNYMQSMDHRLSMKIIEIEEKIDKAFEGIPSKDHYEKNIETRVINMLSDKIEHFAQILDKKLLEYPSRPEIEKRLIRLEGMIARIEHPNLRPMEQRLSELELKIADLSRFLHHYADRVPMVVE